MKLKLTQTSLALMMSAFTVDEFKNNGDTQKETYYVRFTTGVLEGRSFDIIENSANQLIVDPDYNEDNTALETDLENLINEVSELDSFEIRPRWTLGSVFPNGANIPTTNQFLSPGSSFFLREPQIGTNRPVTSQYFYFDSLTNDDLDGWYLPGRPGEGKQDDLELFQPGVGFIIRTNRGAEEENRYWTTPLPYNPFAE